jgi:predicted Rossmann fold nucleotide-binding protein DprA/Smf involved in DNA uptake
MILAIVGSVELNQPQRLTVMWLVDAVLTAKKYSAIVTGGAQGVDDIGAFTANRLGIVVMTEAPDVHAWDPPGQRGFKARNEDIAKICDELLMIRSQQSRTYGSGWTADYAESLGKIVRRVYV